MTHILRLLFLAGIIFTWSFAVADEALDKTINSNINVLLGKAKASYGIPHRDKLEVSKLDGSLESLHEIDSYLEYLHKNKASLSNEEFAVTSMLIGSYVGSVINGQSKKGHKWVSFSEYSKGNPKILDIVSDNFYTQFILVDDLGAMTMPINKIARFIDEGPENNIHFYSSAELK